MILFGKVMTVLLLLAVTIKITASGLDGKLEGTVAFDCLLFTALGVWGVVEWSSL